MCPSLSHQAEKESSLPFTSLGPEALTAAQSAHSLGTVNCSEERDIPQSKKMEILCNIKRTL